MSKPAVSVAAPAPVPTAPEGQSLPELSAVHWRPRVDEQRLRRAGQLWLVSTLAHTAPFIVAAVVLVALAPLSFPVALMAVCYAWIIPELYAQRGVNVVRSQRVAIAVSAAADAGAERVALGLLGDLVGSRSRELLVQTGLVLERGRLGVWLMGPKGALLVRPGGRQVLCYCVRVNDAALPTGDRIAHLLLALRSDEAGFATVANLTFAGACWRVRRRMPAALRPALDAAAAER